MKGKAPRGNRIDPNKGWVPAPVAGTERRRITRILTANFHAPEGRGLRHRFAALCKGGGSWPTRHIPIQKEKRKEKKPTPSLDSVTSITGLIRIYCLPLFGQ